MAKRKKMSGEKEKIGAIIVVSLLLISILMFGLQYSFGNPDSERGNSNDEEKTFCTEADRHADACIEIYTPVCGQPAGETFSNSCFACMNEEIEYYTEGEC